MTWGRWYTGARAGLQELSLNKQWAVEVGRSGVRDPSEGVEMGPGEHLQFNRGEVGIDDKNFSRKLRGKKGRETPK